MSLWEQFLDNDGKVIHKWVHYFPIYERWFAQFKDKPLTFFEIGVFKGGSLAMWQKYFGPLCRIVGLDIDPSCKQHEAPGIAVRIGDQSDEQFLQRVIDEFGAPDVVLDDGSHVMNHINKTFDFLYPKLPKNGVYMVEDLHTAYWEEFGGGVNKADSFMNRAKGYVDSLNADHSRGTVPLDPITRSTFSINFYDSIVVFERGEVWRKEAIRMGDDSLMAKVRSGLGQLVGK